ncbi:MAG: DJ-1/PfpI family protein [Rhodocyclaceae bacterium]|jgi:transcriptional regulator GlxA family with amidase domain|nr:DJ-1/PfpI family protein [Rhodocyclaceae bacterium]MCA3025146.1 DJ-1/PfpI family protein [Rhodocyclaceae bacterium]MCA3033332.1 DJ-1/PfpI family protein [Rhodocyclaceae bacterium]MCA3036043.1 DJ-1/PfpI family protein [Rhodocyclaceae bacterium]MCA3040744.1 DJ-1/PfpI family protein [Rhodocyclaceae bacterium]
MVPSDTSTHASPTRNVGIFIFPIVEILDFAGPYEVFTTASRMALREAPDRAPPFNVFTIAATTAPVHARAEFAALPKYDFTDHPPIDVLIVPGGVVDAEVGNPDVIAWIKRIASHAQLVASVCTGAFMLAEAGLLSGCSATTHWEDAEDLARRYPEVNVINERRWVDQGSVVTSGGISAGIDMSLHLVERLAGRALAMRTARQMAFDWPSNTTK